MKKKTVLDEQQDVRLEWAKLKTVMQRRLIKALRIMLGVKKEDA